MTQKIRDVMTPNPVALDATATVLDTARAMRDGDFGSVVIIEEERVIGIVTDRDIVVRALAEGHDPAVTPVGEICSRELHVVPPGDSVAVAMRVMRENAVRRLPVVKDGRLVGIVSLGDLVKLRDRDSVLADVCAAPANK
jgi:CBS domain-containing protein